MRKNIISALGKGLAIVLMMVGFFFSGSAQTQQIRMGKLKYGGGGDWYANKTSLPNLILYCNRNLATRFAAEPQVVEPGSAALFGLPLVHMTGHGNVHFTDQEAQNLRKYLEGGGFLHIDDNYGLDKHIRREMRKVFPDADFVEIPFTHPIYHQKYQFTKGLPKVHEHDNKPPQGFGIFIKGRLVCFYTYECDLGNGWEDQSVYNDPDAVRQEALKMGANIVSYALTQP